MKICLIFFNCLWNIDLEEEISFAWDIIDNCFFISEGAFAFKVEGTGGFFVSRV